MSAPKGNRNALKHGFYAHHFTDEEKRRMASKQVKENNLLSEINLARAAADRIFERLTRSGLAPGSADPLDEDTLRAIGALSTILTNIGTLTRSYMLTTGNYRPVEQAILDALAELNAEDGIV